jgi:heat shock protein HslJ
MNKKLMYIILALIIIIVIALASSVSRKVQNDTFAVDAYNATYIVEGKKVQLVNSATGETTDTPGSTRYFGKETQGDLNGDGRTDVAFIITRSEGGSGTFYYLVAGLNMDKGYQGTHAVLVGDRITPQTTSVNGKTVIVNYADRAAGQPMTTAPTVAKTLRFQLNPATLKFTVSTSTSSSVSGGTTGTTAPSAPNLKVDSKKWTWTKVVYNDGRTVMPKKTGAFSVTFGSDNKYTATTDCNQMGGTYTTLAVDGTHQISFGSTYSTKMFCEGSEEDMFSKMLSDVREYRISPAGELLLTLKFDSGVATFK